MINESLVMNLHPSFVFDEMMNRNIFPKSKTVNCGFGNLLTRFILNYHCLGEEDGVLIAELQLYQDEQTEDDWEDALQAHYISPYAFPILGSNLNDIADHIYRTMVINDLNLIVEIGMYGDVRVSTSTITREQAIEIAATIGLDKITKDWIEEDVFSVYQNVKLGKFLEWMKSRSLVWHETYNDELSEERLLHLGDLMDIGDELRSRLKKEMQWAM